ncbi:MAG: rhomboid family intramembrane serine protease [Planctomycetaceae bacterium]
MDGQTEVIFWIVATLCLVGPIAGWVRFRSAPPGWLVVWAGILTVAVAGRLLGSGPVVMAAAALWVLLVLAPMMLLNLGWRLAMRRRHAAARRFLRLAALLHPADGLPDGPAVVTAQESAHRGDLDGADAALERLRHSKSPMAAVAFMMLCALRQRWDDMAAWAGEHPAAVARDPNLLVFALRALGETGDVAGMIDRSEREQERIDRLPPVFRDTYRLMVCAFGGRPDIVDRILAKGYFAAAPADQNRFWKVTARWAAGEVETARREFEELLPTVDPANALAIRRRLALLDTPPAPLDERRRGLLDALAARLEQESRFAPAVSPFTARATQVLIAINVAVFAAEWFFGCVGDGKRLHDAGAMCSGCVGRGEWWRLASSTVLHFNLAHLAMNMVALGALGPAAEKALGAARYLGVYLFAGFGSMAAVVAVAWLRGQPCVCVGASGAVMGIIGATAAMMLRGWLRERAAVARGRALLMIGFVITQAALDALVPQMSSTGHLAGAALGFVAALILGDRLRR